MQTKLVHDDFMRAVQGWNMPVVQWVILVIGLSTITPDFDQIQNFDANLDSASHYMNSGGGPVGTSGGLYAGGLDSGTLSNGNGINHSLGADGFSLGIGGTGHGTGHGADNQPGYSTQSVGSASGAHGRMYSAGALPVDTTECPPIRRDWHLHTCACERCRGAPRRRSEGGEAPLRAPLNCITSINLLRDVRPIYLSNV